MHFAAAAANIFAETVVGNEIANVRVRNEHHVAVEINGVAAVTDHAHWVQPIFHESQAQSADHRIQFKLASLHLPHGFRFQDRNTVDAAVLQKREHEARHVGGGG